MLHPDISEITELVNFEDDEYDFDGIHLPSARQPPKKSVMKFGEEVENNISTIQKKYSADLSKNSSESRQSRQSGPKVKKQYASKNKNSISAFITPDLGL